MKLEWNSLPHVTLLPLNFMFLLQSMRWGPAVRRRGRRRLRRGGARWSAACSSAGSTATSPWAGPGRSPQTKSPSWKRNSGIQGCEYEGGQRQRWDGIVQGGSSARLSCKFYVAFCIRNYRHQVPVDCRASNMMST